MTDDNLRETIARLKTLLDKATPQNIDTAEVKEDGTYECPLCHADGYVDGKTFINYDGTASNVHFSGIGQEHEDAERLFRALIAAAPALIAASERAQDARDDALRHVCDQIVMARIAEPEFLRPGLDRARDIIHAMRLNESAARAALKENKNA